MLSRLKCSRNKAECGFPRVDMPESRRNTGITRNQCRVEPQFSYVSRICRNGLRSTATGPELRKGRRRLGRPLSRWRSRHDGVTSGSRNNILTSHEEGGLEAVPQASDRHFPREIQPMQCIGKTPALIALLSRTIFMTTEHGRFRCHECRQTGARRGRRNRPVDLPVRRC